MKALIMLLITLLSWSACDSTPAVHKEPKKSAQSPHTSTDVEREAMLAKPFVYGSRGIPTANTFMTNFIYEQVPKATVVGDYNKKQFECLMAINLGPAFLTNLPAELLAVLEPRNLLKKELLDIFVVVQPLRSLGGNSEGSDNNITYLKAHGWADPDAPSQFNAPRVNRNFLYAIFSPSTDISYEVKVNVLEPFNLYIHDGLLSPQTAALKLPSANPGSIAFYSLAIDHENPNQVVRAIATLHLLIAASEEDAFFAENFEEREVELYTGGKQTGTVLKAHTVKGFIDSLKKGSLKKGVLVKALEQLTRTHKPL